MRSEREAKRPDFKETGRVFVWLALFLGCWGAVCELLPAKSAPNPAAQKTDVSYRWGKAEGRKIGALFRISGNEKISIADQPLPEKLKPFFFYPMDINRVSADLLQIVPGIGDKLADRIIRRRQEQGDFRDLAELGRIEGIGKKKLARLEDFLTCDPSPILLK